MEKDEISKESNNIKIARDKGVTSSDWLVLIKKSILTKRA
jgi:hypothetical protein